MVMVKYVFTDLKCSTICLLGNVEKIKDVAAKKLNRVISTEASLP